MKLFTELKNWALLNQQAHFFHFPQTIHSASLPNCTLRSQAIELTLQYQQLNQNILNLLIETAHERQLKEKIIALIQGKHLNISEDKPALHTALRTLSQEPIEVKGHNILPDIINARLKMQTISQQLRAGQWLGCTGKPIRHIVNIGIGGSDLGARFCVHALSSFTHPELSYDFICDIDPLSFSSITQRLDPETTLFIVVSKSFKTQETLANFKKALAWSGNTSLSRHFIAVTEKTNLAEQMGFTHILPLWEWVGGRFSLCSAANLISCIAIGYEHFMALLAGAAAMDEHFLQREFAHNLPVMLALLGIWNINFLHCSSHLLLVYGKQLELFVPYIQQLDMESNGKSIDIGGRALNHATGPIIWGGSGNQAQHSYYQLLCQGSHRIAMDFITLQTNDQQMLNDFCHAKISVLNQGVHDNNDSYAFIPGGAAINHLRLISCSPYSLGQLIALYEHKIFAQSVIWNINPFDQPGVESAKQARLNAVLDIL